MPDVDLNSPNLADALLAGKPDASSVYTKSRADELLADREAVDAHDDQRVAFADPFQHTGQHGSGTISARGLFLMYLSTARGFQGLRLGQGGPILCRDARIADQGHQNRSFAVAHTTNKRPIENGCKDTLYGRG